MPNVLSPRNLVSRPDNMDETVQSSSVTDGNRSNDINAYIIDKGHFVSYNAPSLINPLPHFLRKIWALNAGGHL